MLNEILTESSLFLNEEAINEGISVIGKKMSDSDIAATIRSEKVKKILQKYLDKGYKVVNSSLKNEIPEKKFNAVAKDIRVKVEYKMIDGKYCFIQRARTTGNVTMIAIFLVNKRGAVRFLPVQSSLFIVA